MSSLSGRKISLFNRKLVTSNNKIQCLCGLIEFAGVLKTGLDMLLHNLWVVAPVQFWQYRIFLVSYVPLSVQAKIYRIFGKDLRFCELQKIWRRFRFSEKDLDWNRAYKVPFTPWKFYSIRKDINHGNKDSRKFPPKNHCFCWNSDVLLIPALTVWPLFRRWF